VPAECGANINGTYFRTITLSGDSILDTPCFSSCVACTNTVDENASKNVKAYPNPFGRELNLQSPYWGNSYTLYNAWGQQVAQGRFDGKTTLDTSHWPNGLYWLVTINGARISVIKLGGC
jgi:hypothetical protein